MFILLVIPFLGFFSIISIVLAIRKKWKSAIIGLLVSLILNCLSETIPLHCFPSDKGGRRTIKVMTYNVHCLSSGYDKKQPGIAKEILDESPDIVFLCEFALYKSKVLDSLMTQSNDYTRYYQTGTNCVFYSKYEIDSIIGIYPSGSNKRHSRNNRVHLIMGNDTLSIFGLHLYSSNHHIMRGYEKRSEEADSIYEDIKEEQYPMIVMGDFNDVSGSYAVERIKDAGLEDAWWNGGCGYGSTFHDKWLRLRLDHILYQDSKLKLTNVKVIDSDLSDHNALVAEFSWN